MNPGDFVLGQDIRETDPLDGSFSGDGQEDDPVVVGMTLDNHDFGQDDQAEDGTGQTPLVLRPIRTDSPFAVDGSGPRPRVVEQADTGSRMPPASSGDAPESTGSTDPDGSTGPGEPNWGEASVSLDDLERMGQQSGGGAGGNAPTRGDMLDEPDDFEPVVMDAPAGRTSDPEILFSEPVESMPLRTVSGGETVHSGTGGAGADPADSGVDDASDTPVIHAVQPIYTLSVADADQPEPPPDDLEGGEAGADGQTSIVFNPDDPDYYDPDYYDDLPDDIVLPDDPVTDESDEEAPEPLPEELIERSRVLSGEGQEPDPKVMSATGEPLEFSDRDTAFELITASTDDEDPQSVEVVSRSAGESDPAAGPTGSGASHPSDLDADLPAVQTPQVGSLAGRLSRTPSTDGADDAPTTQVDDDVDFGSGTSPEELLAAEEELLAPEEQSTYGDDETTSDLDEETVQLRDPLGSGQGPDAPDAPQVLSDSLDTSRPSDVDGVVLTGNEAEDSMERTEDDLIEP